MLNMKSIDLLMYDHRIIERGLDLLQAAVSKLEKNEKVSTEVFEKLIRFFREFADKCHHGKEENHLFPSLEIRGIPREGGPIGVMLYEHDLGRRLLRDMEESLHKVNKDPEAEKDLIVTSLNYIELLRQHIFKEDNILFKMAEEVLDDDVDKRLVKAFEDVETRVLGSEDHERLIRSLDEIEKLLK